MLYVCSSAFIAPEEVGFVREWIDRLRAGSDERPVLHDLGVLVRPHPQNAAQWRDADLSAVPNVAVWPRAGAQPDGGRGERAEFFDSLAHSAAVVGINTSALLEAAILGKSVLSVPFVPQFAGTQEGTLHFRYLLHENGGFLPRVAHLPASISRNSPPPLDSCEADEQYAAVRRGPSSARVGSSAPPPRSSRTRSKL